MDCVISFSFLESQFQAGMTQKTIPVLESHLNSLEVGVHTHIDTSDGAVNDSPVFQLDCHGLVRQFHQESEDRGW